MFRPAAVRHQKFRELSPEAAFQRHLVATSFSRLCACFCWFVTRKNSNISLGFEPVKSPLLNTALSASKRVGLTNYLQLQRLVLSQFCCFPHMYLWLSTVCKLRQLKFISGVDCWLSSQHHWWIWVVVVYRLDFCIGLPIHCNYQLAHYSGFCRISPSILNRFTPNLQA